MLFLEIHFNTGGSGEFHLTCPKCYGDQNRPFIYCIPVPIGLAQGWPWLCKCRVTK